MCTTISQIPCCFKNTSSDTPFLERKGTHESFSLPFTEITCNNENINVDTFSRIGNNPSWVVTSSLVVEDVGNKSVQASRRCFRRNENLPSHLTICSNKLKESPEESTLSSLLVEILGQEVHCTVMLLRKVFSSMLVHARLPVSTCVIFCQSSMSSSNLNHEVDPS